jgi:hypothetical protein
VHEVATEDSAINKETFFGFHRPPCRRTTTTRHEDPAATCARPHHIARGKAVITRLPNGSFSIDREEPQGFDGLCRVWIYGWSGTSGAE